MNNNGGTSGWDKIGNLLWFGIKGFIVLVILYWMAVACTMGVIFNAVKHGNTDEGIISLVVCFEAQGRNENLTLHETDTNIDKHRAAKYLMCAWNRKLPAGHTLETWAKTDEAQAARISYVSLLKEELRKRRAEEDAFNDRMNNRGRSESPPPQPTYSAAPQAPMAKGSDAITGPQEEAEWEEEE